jgi:hypothetical protein
MALGLFVGCLHERRSHSTGAPDQSAEPMAIELKMKIWYSLITMKFHCEKCGKEIRVPRTVGHPRKTKRPEHSKGWQSETLSALPFLEIVH